MGLARSGDLAANSNGDFGRGTGDLGRGEEDLAEGSPDSGDFSSSGGVVISGTGEVGRDSESSDLIYSAIFGDFAYNSAKEGGVSCEGVEGVWAYATKSIYEFVTRSLPFRAPKMVTI